MYSKFDFKLTDSFYNIEINNHLEIGKKIYDEFESSTKECVRKFIYENGHIDGSSLKEHWFNIKKADIFISHSHKDINKVKAFAGWLKHNFNLTSFIDSCVWGYCDDLLKQIDDDNCKSSNKSTYNYELRNYTTSHVHMMLSIALSEMIDNTECVIFFNTPESVKLKDDLKSIRDGKQVVTLSPWIYHELAMTTLIRKNELKRTVTSLENAFGKRTLNEYNSINIEHNVEKYLGEMVKLDENDLKKWKHYFDCMTHRIDGARIPFIEGFEKTNPLDVLYYIKNIKY